MIITIEIMKITIESLVGQIDQNPDPNDIIEMTIQPLPDEYIDPYEGHDEDFSPVTRQKRIHERNTFRQQEEKYHEDALEFLKSPEGKKAFDHVVEMKLTKLRGGRYTKEYWTNQKKGIPDDVKSYRKRFKKKVKDDFDKIMPENQYDYFNDIWYFFVLTEEERQHLIEKERKEKELWKNKFESLYQSKKWEVIEEVRNDITEKYYYQFKAKFEKYEYYRSQFNKYKNIVIAQEEGRLMSINDNRQYGYSSRSEEDLQAELDKKMKKQKKKDKKKAAEKKLKKQMKQLDTSSDESDSD